MESLLLIKASIEYEDDIWKFRQEIMNSEDIDQFAGCANLDHCSTVKEWLQLIESPKQVLSDIYLAVRKNDNRIVGIIDLRHHIDHPILGTWGGHMGYTVRPDERGKGYAKEMLRQNLINCKKLGIDRVLVTCDKENIASEKTIKANGGIYEKNIEVDGCVIKRYWIKL